MSNTDEDIAATGPSPSHSQKRLAPLSRMAAAVAGLDLGLTRVQLRLRFFLGGLLSSLLDERQMAELSGVLYERQGPPSSAALHRWEENWLPILPPPPARGLVGGCGYGRECLWLLRRGYRLDAYDPGHSAVAATQSQLAEDGLAFVASHEQVADWVLLRARGARRQTSLADRYDFVWLGWGSLSHVVDPDRRRQIIQACVALTDGPILASARMAEGRRTEGSSSVLGAKLGRILGGRDPFPGLQFQPHHGIAAVLTSAEVSDLSEMIGRKVSLERGPGVTAIAWLPVGSS